MPRFIKEGWEYFDDKEDKWKVKPDAPEWAKKEAEEFYKKVIEGRYQILESVYKKLEKLD